MHAYEKPRKILPMLFNTDMVKAIVDELKTETRRVCKLPMPGAVPILGSEDDSTRTYRVRTGSGTNAAIQSVSMPICAGDVLYVRETWNFVEAIYCNGMSNGMYRGKPGMFMYREAYNRTLSDPTHYFPLGWKPSIHMPKSAARIYLRVKSVRIHMLQQISMDEISREGIKIDMLPCIAGSDDEEGCRESFAKLWDSTIKGDDLFRYGWHVNPWVMAVQFERITNLQEEI